MEATLHQKKVIDSIKRYVKVNNLRAGDKLPPIRSIAEEFGFAQVTVAQAIKSLARNGFVESKTKVGTTIVKDMEFQSQKNTCRIIIISDVNYTAAFNPTTYVISGIRNSVSDSEIAQVWLSFETGEEVLKNTLYYHYAMRKDQEKIVFLLAHCPLWVKAFFQRSSAPCIVVGGVESGINLPGVTLSAPAVLARIKEAIDKSNAYPAVLLMACDELLGAHRYYYDHFTDINKAASIMRLSASAEVCRTQLAELLVAAQRPKTLVIQGDDAACPIIRLCREMNLRIPQDIGIISLENYPLGEQLCPTLTGIYHNYTSIGERIGQMIKALINGQNIGAINGEMTPILVYRESFPNPA